MCCQPFLFIFQLDLRIGFSITYFSRVRKGEFLLNFVLPLGKGEQFKGSGIASGDLVEQAGKGTAPARFVSLPFFE